jgi:hypothetical protein
MDLRKNEDGSVYIYTGPKAPTGFEKNWIPTVPGKNSIGALAGILPVASCSRSALCVSLTSLVIRVQRYLPPPRQRPNGL